MKKYAIILIGMLLLQACASTGLLPGTPEKWTVVVRYLPEVMSGMYDGRNPVIYQFHDREQALRLREELLGTGLVENIRIEHDN
ncbi:MAG TPA: hypothetical protein VHA56_22305 [Mucilaginibacter sp.]|nr:hypothetical protein [Mucilaginibacter sp.]